MSVERMRLAHASSSLGPVGSQTKIRRRLGVSPWPLAVIRPGDRDLVERRRDAGMPVHVVVGLVRLALGLQQRGRILQERHAELVRAGRHPDAGLQVRVGGLMVRLRFGGVTVNDALRSRSSSTSSSCGSRRPSTCSLRSRARRSWISYSPSCGNVYGIRAPPRVPSGSPSTCSSWVRSGRMRIVSPPGDRPGLPDGQAADLLRRGDVAVQERRREVAHRHVVEPVAGLVVRQQRRWRRCRAPAGRGWRSGTRSG